MSYAWQKNFYPEQTSGFDTAEFANWLRQHEEPCHAYLQWALEHYNIAILSKEYFQQPGITDAYSLTDHLLGDWGPSQMPVLIWDAVLYVACVSPEGLPLKVGPYQVQPLIANPHDIQHLWEMVKPREHKKEIPFPELPNPSISSVVHFESNPSLDLLKDEDSFVTEGGEFTSEFQNPEAESYEPPEGLSFENPLEKLNALASSEEFEAVESVAKAEPIAIGENSLPPQDIEAALDEALAVCLELYQKVIIFKIEDGFAIGFKSSNSVTPPDSLIKLPVNIPNIFRIVYTTQKPFHGKMHPNEINDVFVNEWLQGMPPPLVTMVPVVINSEVKYLIAAIATREIDASQGLQLMQKNQLQLHKRLNPPATNPMSPSAAA